MWAGEEDRYCRRMLWQNGTWEAGMAFPMMYDLSSIFITHGRLHSPMLQMV